MQLKEKSSREKALEFAKNVPKPKAKPNNNGASSSDNVENANPSG